MDEDDEELSRYNASRLGVLDTLEIVLRAVDEGSGIDPTAIAQLVEQVQAVLEPPMMRMSQRGQQEDLELAREDAEMWKAQAQRLEQELAAAQRETQMANEALHELTSQNMALKLDVDTLTSQLAEAKQQQQQHQQHQQQQQQQEEEDKASARLVGQSLPHEHEPKQSSVDAPGPADTPTRHSAPSGRRPHPEATVTAGSSMVIASSGTVGVSRPGGLRDQEASVPTLTGSAPGGTTTTADTTTSTASHSDAAAAPTTTAATAAVTTAGSVTLPASAGQGAGRADDALLAGQPPQPTSTSLASINDRMNQLQDLNRQLEQELRQARAEVAVAVARADAASSAQGMAAVGDLNGQSEAQTAVQGGAAPAAAIDGGAADRPGARAGAVGLGPVARVDVAGAREDLREGTEALRRALAGARAAADGAEARAAELEAQLRECERELGVARGAAAAAGAAALAGEARLREAEQRLAAAEQLQLQLREEMERRLAAARAAAAGPLSSPGRAAEAAVAGGASHWRQLGGGLAGSPGRAAWMAGGPQDSSAGGPSVELVMVQAELQGARQSNRMLTQRLMEADMSSGGGLSYLPGPSQAEWAAMQAEVEGLRVAAQHLRDHLLAERRRAAAAEVAVSAAVSECEGLRARLLAAERRAGAVGSERDARARAVAMAEGEVAGVRQQAAAMHQAAEGEARHMVSEQGALAGALADARRRLASSSMALEHEVSTWRLATTQAVGVAEEAQSKVALLDRKLADLDAQLRAKAAECESRGVEAAELRLQLEEAKSWLAKRTSFLERCESAVLRPLAAWYSLHGYPQLLTNQPTQPNHHHPSPHPSHHPSYPRQPLSPGKPRPRAGPAPVPTRPDAWSRPGAHGPAVAPPVRPGGAGPWPAPLPGEGAPPVVPSKGFTELQQRVGRVLGAAAAAVDTGADRRLEVAAAAFELLALRIEDLQHQCEQVLEGSRAAAVSAAEQVLRRGQEISLAYEDQLARAREKADLEAMAAQDARASATALQKELASTVMEVCAEREAAQKLRERVAALEGERVRQGEAHEEDLTRAQRHFEDALRSQEEDRRRAELAAHEAGVMDGRASMQPALDEIQGELAATRDELEACRQDVLHHLGRLAEMNQELALREEQASLSSQEAAAAEAAREGDRAAAAREAARERAARDHEWQMRERQLQGEMRTRLEEAAKESSQALESEKARCRALLDEEYRAGLSKVEEAAVRWEQQRQSLEAEWEERLEDGRRQAAAEAVREARRAMEQEYLSRDEEVRAAHEASLNTLAAHADTSHQGWRQREAELQKEVDDTEGQLRAVRRDLSEAKSSLAAIQADRAQLVKERDDALASLESKVLEYRSRLAGLEATQSAILTRQQEQTHAREATLARLHQRVQALTTERNLLEEQLVKLQASWVHQREVAAAAQEAGERAWAAARAASSALEEAAVQGAAREVAITHAHREQVHELESRYAAQLSAAAAQLVAVRSRQEALGGALLGVMTHQGHHHPRMV